MDQTGAVLAPLCVIGLLAAGTPLRGVVALTVIPGLIALAVLLIGIRESRALPGRGGRPGASAAEPLPRAFRRLVAAVAVFGCGDFAKTLLILWAVGEEPDVFSASTRGAALYALLNAVSVGSAWMGGFLSDRFGRKPVLAVAYACGASAAFVPVLLPPGTAAALAALGLSGILIGAEESVERAWASDLAGMRRGWGFGVLAAVNGAGDLVASAGLGALWSLAGPGAAFASAGVVMVVGTVLLFSVPEASIAPPPSPIEPERPAPGA
jgi:MFS family permease